VVARSRGYLRGFLVAFRVWGLREAIRRQWLSALSIDQHLLRLGPRCHSGGVWNVTTNGLIPVVVIKASKPQGGREFVSPLKSPLTINLSTES
jgi:hypothetical protein